MPDNDDEVLAWDATLRRGITYTYNDKLFSRDVPKGVTQEEKDYLETEAVATTTTADGEEIERPRFEFTERHTDEATDGGSGARKRPARTA
jgi:hypothetical protein